MSNFNGNDQTVFLKCSDMEMLEDMDSEEGLNEALYFDNGIVTKKEHEKDYLELIEKVEN